jgi:glyoxylase-like metal-dependent hydrolase (beta-lactamase superfamily II)
MLHTIDLQYQRQSRVIATAAWRTTEGWVLVDPGPTSCLPALEEGLAAVGGALVDVRTILLTHIHLDHAGATGTICARVPEALVYVHERGARHLADPTRLLASATRLYGDAMDRMWGRFDPVPGDRLRPLSGGESLTLGGHALEVAYTPGHAVHHVSYFDTATGMAFVGDTCGIRRGGDFMVAATPPPDVDLELWHASLRTIGAWNPVSLFLTHFGVIQPAAAHLARFGAVLDRTAQQVLATLQSGVDDEAARAAFVDAFRAEARRGVGEQDVRSMEAAGPIDDIWRGLARYWRGKGAV